MEIETTAAITKLTNIIKLQQEQIDKLNKMFNDEVDYINRRFDMVESIVEGNLSRGED